MTENRGRYRRYVTPVVTRNACDLGVTTGDFSEALLVTLVTLVTLCNAFRKSLIYIVIMRYKALQ